MKNNNDKLFLVSIKNEGDAETYISRVRSASNIIIAACESANREDIAESVALLNIDLGLTPDQLKVEG